MSDRGKQNVARIDRPELRRQQAMCLSKLLRQVAATNSFWTSKWQAAGIDLSESAIAALRVPQDFAMWPLTTKAELVADHQAYPPYGSNLTFDVSRYSRLHQTSGTTGQPLRWLDTPESWLWMLGCWEQIFELAGLRSDDRLCFPFSFGPFLGFWAAFEGAARLGRMCLPGGGMSSESRLKLIEENRATVVCCTPTYALRLAEVAASLASCSPSPCGSEGSKIFVNPPTHKGSDYKIGSVRMLIVAGEPGGSVPSIRQRIEDAWGARVIDHWGMTEVGPLAAECAENPGGLHLLETECLAEIIDPVTGQSYDLDAAIAADPQAPAPIRGELVITNFGRIGSPVIRYRTGDLAELDPAPCPCGRSLLRLKGGILSRVDDMLTIRGNNVFPTAIDAILREFPEVVEYRFTVVSAGPMQELTIEIEPTGDVADRGNDLLDRVTAAIHDRLHFRPEITIVETGTLPRHDMKGRRIHRVP